MGQYTDLQEHYYNYYDFSDNTTTLVRYETIVDLYKKEINPDYDKTLTFDGYSVDICIDDYGQCYYIDYIDENGEKKSWSCGTYNFDYINDVIAIIRSIKRKLNLKEQK